MYEGRTRKSALTAILLGFLMVISFPTVTSPLTGTASHVQSGRTSLSTPVQTHTVPSSWRGLSSSTRAALMEAHAPHRGTPTAEESPAHSSPATPSTAGNVTISASWPGVDFTNNSCGCIPPDGAVASGDGTVVQMVNSELYAWSDSGKLLKNESLGSFLNIPASNFFSDPYVQFDAAVGRWFVSGININGATYAGSIVVNVSKGSSFFGGWYEYNFSSSATNLTDQPFIAETSTNLLVEANIFDSVSGTLYGAEVWLANLTGVLSGALNASQIYTYGPNPTLDSLHPVQPTGGLGVSYFVSDDFGAAYGNVTWSYLILLAITGSAPGKVTVQTYNLTIRPENSAPNTWCGYDGGGACLDLDDGRIISAAWGRGDIWATANEGCVVGTVMDACIRIFEINVTGAAPVLAQQIDYTQGTNSMDSYGALSVDPLGDLLMVYSDSSNTTYPSLMLTGASAAEIAAATQAKTALRLETPRIAAAGQGDLDPSLSSPYNRWGDYFEVSPDPATWDEFWFEGEYIGLNNASDFYATQVGEAGFPTALYPVNVSETGLASGTTWSVLLNQFGNAGNGTSIAFHVPNGTYTLQTPSVIQISSGVRYLASISSTPVVVSGRSVSITIHFTEQDFVTTLVWPSSAAGTASPATGWLDYGNLTRLSATAAMGHQFLVWVGSGPGSYTGSNVATNLTVNYPITEEAYFGTQSNYRVSISETGLPAGTPWWVVWEGSKVGTQNASVSFDVPNGTYAYQLPANISSSVPGELFTTSASSGTLAVSGKATTTVVPFTTEFSLVVKGAPAGGGYAGPTAGWYAQGSKVELEAYAATGFTFSGWSGSGTGSYTGGSAVVNITMGGPVNETAKFSTATTTNSSAVSEDWLVIGVVVAAVVAGAVGFLVGRRRKGSKSADAPPPMAYQSGPVSAGPPEWVQPSNMPPPPGDSPPPPPPGQ